MCIRDSSPVLVADIPGGRVDHEIRGNRGDVYLVANHLQRNRLPVPFAPNLNLHWCAAAAAQLALRLLSRPALGVFTGNLRDDVAATDADLVRRRPFEHALSDDVAFDGGDGDAEAV